MSQQNLLTLSPSPVSAAVNNGGEIRPIPIPIPIPIDGVEDSGRVARLPRWTRQEILVLIQGKRVAESRVRRGRVGGMAFGSVQVETKWASVSTYCKRHGVNRGPVQCRKRWSNLAGDYKKIKEWESRIKEETESFWVMRNDLRRERKLPGFFDKEVYDILDGGAAVPIDSDSLGLALALAPASEPPEEEETEAIFDSGRSATAEDGLFPAEEEEEEAIGSVEKEKETVVKAVATAVPISVSAGRPHEQQQAPPNPERGTTSEEQRKRKRPRTDIDGDEDGDVDTETGSVQHQLLEILENNGKMLTAQLEAQNKNCQLDREQRKDHADNLIAVLNKFADALVRIADKL